MLNKYDDNHHIIQPGYIKKHKSSVSISMKFLPLMCRLSIKDIKINHSSSSSSKVARTSSSSSDEYEPPSPKVGCMGQVKRNNRVIGFPITSTSTATATATAAASVHVNEQVQALVAETRHHKYSKLKRLFSAKSPLLHHHHPATTASAAVVVGRSGSNGRRSSRRDPIICSSTSTVNNSNSRRFIRLQNDYDRSSIKNDDDDHRHPFRECTVNISEIDPPLPVVKTATTDHHHEVNLWKRRFNNGVALKNLQIERVVH